MRLELARAPLPVPDPREMAAEKIAAFWRRRAARDLYDLDHLAQVLQAGFDGSAIAELAALKIYADVALEGLGHAPDWIGAVFAVRPAEVRGADDLGRFRATARLTQRRYYKDPEAKGRAPARGESWIPPLGPERPGGPLEPPEFDDALDDDEPNGPESDESGRAPADKGNEATAGESAVEEPDPFGDDLLVGVVAPDH